MVVGIGGGAGVVTGKLEVEVTLPPSVVTVIGPLVAPAGTLAISWLALAMVKLGASVPPTATRVGS